MALVDHFAPDAGENGFSQIAVHEFRHAITFWATGKITKASVMSNQLWTLTSLPAADADELQINQIAANYTAKPTEGQKIAYLLEIESGLSLYSQGVITQTQLKNFLSLV